MISLKQNGSAKVKIEALLTALYCTLMTTMPVLADEGDQIAQNITAGTGRIWNILTVIVAPIAGITLCICAVQILWGGQRATENAKNTVVKIIVVIAIVLLAPTIINQIGTWFSKGTWSFNFG